jgi:FMN phosphatase YigB (HAD superfamily)
MSEVRPGNIRACVFDAYGTLFNVHSAAALAERLYPGQGDAVSQLWRTKQIEFHSLREAQVLIEAWRRHYNTLRPHSPLGYRPPAPEAVSWPAGAPPRPSAG